MSKKNASTKATKKRRIPLFVKWIIALLFLLIMAFTVFFFYMKQITRPEHITDQYVTTFMSKDTSALFDYLGFERGTFTTPDALKKSLEECHKYSSITTYGLVEYDTQDKENQRQYGLQYWDNSHNNPYSQTLIVKKSSDRLYLLFDNWEIDTSEFLAKSCLLGAPAGATVAVDDIELTENMVKASSDEVTTYQLGDMFIGTHTITVSMEGFEDFTTRVYLKSGDYKDKNIYTITASMMNITADTEKSLKKQTESLIKTLYSYALSDKSFDKLCKKITFEDSTKTSMEQAYLTLVTNNIKSATHLTDVNFSKFTSTVSSAFAEDHCYAVQVTTDIDYTASSVVVKSDTQTESAAPQTVKQYRSTTGSSLFITTFHYWNGTWCIHDTTALDACIYYMKY